ncbi:MULTISPECIES: phasin family protein [unclassified Bradyrhizobium]|uniref:phasin family protein n=1 Tax=unclassified Bradyrhizobium TaxID=2631580 RepID=UPI001BA54637|nr:MULTISPECIES: phasin family protein [unclassified Bradyrhizobium]MBR1228024.1 phasin family protein [Bradyrhizobium sp. AUGA SZCCT0176]MBR1296032.1 phasin family protein [Bradyrhizobium sp. AUGA SZCCT0042]
MEADSKQPGGAMWSDDLRKFAEKFQTPGLDIAALIEWQRKDMETLVEANRQAYTGVAALVERRNEILQETLAQWQAAIKDASGADSLTKQAEAAKLGVEKALANFNELSAMEAQSRNNAWKIVQDRLQENLGNLQKLLLPK